MAKIRRDDEVIVISGKDKGKTGRVLRVEPDKNRVYVAHVGDSRCYRVRGAWVRVSRQMSRIPIWRKIGTLFRARCGR